MHHLIVSLNAPSLSAPISATPCISNSSESMSHRDDLPSIFAACTYCVSNSRYLADLVQTFPDLVVDSMIWNPSVPVPGIILTFPSRSFASLVLPLRGDFAVYPPNHLNLIGVLDLQFIPQYCHYLVCHNTPNVAKLCHAWFGYNVYLDCTIESSLGNNPGQSLQISWNHLIAKFSILLGFVPTCSF